MRAKSPINRIPNTSSMFEILLSAALKGGCSFIARPYTEVNMSVEYIKTGPDTYSKALLIEAGSFYHHYQLDSKEDMNAAKEKVHSLLS